jgi:WD40 repeat protein
MSVVSVKWQGHGGPVSCLDSSEEDNDHHGAGTNNLLLSGSEDKTARLWDIRDSRRRASLCIVAPGEVFSVKFAPHHPHRSKEMIDSTSISSSSSSSSFAKDHTVYVLPRPKGPFQKRV